MKKERYCVCATANGKCTAYAHTDKDGKVVGMRKCPFKRGCESSCPDCYMLAVPE